jgi:hypothetical protein
LVLVMAPTALAQQGTMSAARARTERAASMNQAPKFISNSRPYQPRMGFLDTFKYRGISTRSEQLRSMLPPRYGKTFADRDDQLLPETPIKAMLDRRNLLTLRSPMARRANSYIGRNDFVKDENGQMPGDYSKIEAQADAVTVSIDPLKPDTGAYQDAIIARLKAKADEYHETALVSFRKGRYIQAKNYFDLVRDVEPDATRSYLGSVFVFMHKDDFLQASGVLLRALDIMTTLDDVRVDPEKFYRAREDFIRRVERVNYFAQRNKESSSLSLMLAYYSWLKGDVGTAIDAAANAEKNLPEPANVPVKKFRELLIAQRTSAPKPGS